MTAKLVVLVALVAVVAGLEGIEETTPCVPLRTCAQCAYDPQCGWCDEINRCLPGKRLGPNVGNCTEWHFTYCKDEPCAAYNGVGCMACVMSPFCGWCEETATCLEGTVGGPLSEECAAWSPEQCSADMRRPNLRIPPLWTNREGDPVE